MINMYHDPEVPAGYQDADIEMLEMAEAANSSYEKAFKDTCLDCKGRGGYRDYDNYGNQKGYQVCPACGGAGEIF